MEIINKHKTFFLMQDHYNLQRFEFEFFFTEFRIRVDVDRIRIRTSRKKPHHTLEKKKPDPTFKEKRIRLKKRLDADPT